MDKTCSKCKKCLSLTAFNRGPNKTGTYPSCRECENAHRKQRLQDNPLCLTCRSAIHMAGSAYCYSCERKMKGKGDPKWVSRRTGLEWCKVCGQRPRLEYHHYCLPCKLDYQNRTRAKKWRERYSTDDLKRLDTVRHYATNLIRRGKLKRGPCVFCGAQGTQFHHWDYERKTMNFDDVCNCCHSAVHILLRFLLTIRRYERS